MAISSEDGGEAITAREAGYFTDFHEFLISSRVVANPPKEGG
jgi:hypothetical protein